ncbi:MAG: hypothetical protein KGJ43_05580 [Acidobacteriota bacterium]|nr:hypothetical protein [Acidobacteriota bacterium]
MAPALVALFAGMWGGLVRLGIVAVGATSSPAEAHGPLMALGFLGTLISLERAVALGRSWSYGAPLATGLGAIATLLGAPGDLGPALMTLGGLVLWCDHLVLQRMAPSAHNAVMGLGAVAWSAAGLAWLSGADAGRFAPLLAGFLVLTIVGERLELTRVTPRPRHAVWVLLAAVGVFAGGLGASLAAEDVGMRVAGLGLIAQAAWLARHDVARRTVRRGGATRFMASALLAGYAWLAVAGALWASGSWSVAGRAYDASLHAVFLGFAMSMVFAHAPVIVPAVLRRPLPFNRVFYSHLVLLHASLALRLAGGDLAGDDALWRWGGALNELAILLFLAVSAGVAVRAGRKPRRGA